MATNRRAILLGALGAGAAAAGCSKKSEMPEEAPSNSASVTTSPSQSSKPSVTAAAPPTVAGSRKTIPGPIAPLTGMPVNSPLTHVAVALKVPNLRIELPQTGLDQADILVCQPNGVSYTRIMPIFHTKFPAGVGPIRSIRPVDVPLLSPIRPVLGNTGAAEWVLAYMNHHAQYIESVPFITVVGSGRYSIDQSRVYRAGGSLEYDRAVVAHPAELARQARRTKAAPKPYFPWVPLGEAASTATGKPANRVSIPYGPGHSYDMSYEYNPARLKYLRSQPWGPHTLANGTRLTADNVLIIQAYWKMTKIWPGGGAPDPVVEIVNRKGRFFYLNRGKFVTGTWSKGKVDEHFKFTTSDGKPLRMAPGQTWVELPQIKSDVRIS